MSSHLELAHTLKFSNLLRNIFGASPFLIQTDSNDPREMIHFTTFSTWTPLLVFISCIMSLFVGGYLELRSVSQSENGTTITEVAGVTMVQGSLTMTIAQISIITALIAYVMGYLVTIQRRDIWKKYMVSVLQTAELLDRKYNQKFDCRKLKNLVTYSVCTLLIYHIVYLVVFHIFYLSEVVFNTYFLIPIALFIESFASSMTAVDMINSVYMLQEIFDMFGQVPRELMDEEFLADFTSTLDLIELVAQNHGYREFYSIGNDFLLMLTQLFYVFYGIVETDTPNLVLVLFGFASAFPRFMKNLALAVRGQTMTTNVGDDLHRS